LIGWLLSTKIGRALSGAAAILVAILTFGAVQRREGEKLNEAKRIRDDAKKREKADEAANDLRGADRDELNNRLHDNNRRW